MKDLTWNLCHLHKFLCSSQSPEIEELRKVASSRIVSLQSGFIFHSPAPANASQGLYQMFEEMLSFMLFVTYILRQAEFCFCALAPLVVFFLFFFIFIIPVVMKLAEHKKLLHKMKNLREGEWTMARCLFDYDMCITFILTCFMPRFYHKYFSASCIMFHDKASARHVRWLRALNISWTKLFSCF